MAVVGSGRYGSVNVWELPHNIVSTQIEIGQTGVLARAELANEGIMQDQQEIIAPWTCSKVESDRLKS